MTQSQKSASDLYDKSLHYREELVNRNYDILIHYAVKLIKNRDGAAELVQQAFFEFLKKYQDKQMIPLLQAKYWLLAKVKFIFLQQLHKAKELKIVSFEPKILEDCMGERDDNEEKRVVVKFRGQEFFLPINQAKKMKAMIRALKQIPKKNSEVFILRHFDRLSIPEIKNKLNISEATVSCRLRNGQNQLRILLNQPAPFWAKSAFRAL